MTAFDIQPASSEDSANLALLADIATRRLTTFLWDLAADEGQSSFEVGRSLIYANQNSSVHYSKWLVARSTAGVLGGLNGYTLDNGSFATPSVASIRVLEPVNQLKEMIIGTWYVSAIAVFTEARGMQVGQSLLRAAELLARAASVKEITLMVGSFNPRAQRLYESIGFEKRAERNFEPFAGSDRQGQWILMAKDLTEQRK